ncbi:MAG: PASTA domain-containing protein [Bacteroidales bacterium]|nr:PASTA domain-containing protein [Bacteroidales bacterium]
MKNLIAMVIVGLVLLISAMVFLRVYTRHDSLKETPDFANLTLSDATELADNAGVKLDVIDSVYVRGMAKGAVYRQDPVAGTMVKPGRRVAVVVNAVTPRKVTMPQVAEKSVRQAKALILSSGLTLGRLIYVSDEASNRVLRATRDGKTVRSGAELNSGTVIDLVAGLNTSDCVTSVPKVKGLKTTAAVDVLHDYFLNVKKLNYDDSVKTFADSLDAVVYRQSPEPTTMPLTMGSSVSLYLTLDPEKMPK